MADVNLVERFEQDVRFLILAENDGGQIDVKDFRRLAVGDVRADDGDVARGRAGRQTAEAMKQIQHGFRPLIGDHALAAGNLTKQIKILTGVLRDGDANLIGRYAHRLGNHVRDVRRCFAIDLRPAGIAEVDAAIGVDAVRSSKLRQAGNINLKQIGTAGAIH